MVANAFIGQAEKPTENELTLQLGPAKVVWDKLLVELAEDFDLTTSEWTSYSLKAGWSMRLKRGERNIVYLSPGRGSFMASFALGDKAVRAARDNKLPKTVLQLSTRQNGTPKVRRSGWISGASRTFWQLRSLWRLSWGTESRSPSWL